MTLRSAVLAISVLLAACPRGDAAGPPELPGDPYPGREQSLRGLLLRELEVEVVEGYTIPTFDLAVPGTAVSSRVGAVHVGVGPAELAAGIKGSVDRWPLLPLDLDGAPLDEAQSKRLEMHLSEDLTAAWVFDEVSYRFPGCVVTGRDGALDTYKIATVPLRLTAVFVRDGERWVQVLEHLSYPQRVADLIAGASEFKPPGPALRNGLDPRAKPMTVPKELVQRAIAVDLGAEERTRIFASDRDALAIWPDPEHELRGGSVVSSVSLAEAFDATKTELKSYRMGMSPDPTGGVGGGSVAWAAITFELTARRVTDEGDVIPVKLDLRASYVMERREVDGTPTWQLVQSHVSSPVSAPALIGTFAPVGGGRPPWQRECEGT